MTKSLRTQIEESLDWQSHAVIEAVLTGINLKSKSKKTITVTEELIRKHKDKALDQILTANRKWLEAKLPIGWVRNIDLDEGYCVTCGQIVEDDSGCLCTAYNQALDEVKLIIKEMK